MKSDNELVINELHGRLADFMMMDQTFRDRYKMDFNEFRKRKVVEKSGHSFNVEEDYCDWEFSLDGIKTITNELKKLAKYS